MAGDPPEPVPSSLALRVGAPALLVLFSTTLCLGALEAAFRIAEPRPPFRDTSVERKWVLRLAERGYPTTKPEGTFRVLALGDSFTWGLGVQPGDTWVHRLGSRLRDWKRPLDVETINGGVPAWNTQDQLRGLRQSRLTATEPDLVLLAYVLNDPEPDDEASRREMWNSMVPREPEGALGALLSRSRLASLVWARWENRRIRRTIDRYYHDLFDETKPYWEGSRSGLEEMARWTEEHGIGFAAVIFPVFDSPMDDRYPYQDLHEKVRQTLEGLGVPTFDLLEVYEGVEGRRLAVHPFTDSHPNELAHRMAATAIFERFRTDPTWGALISEASETADPAAGSSPVAGPTDG